MPNNLGESIKKYRLQKNLSVRKLAGLMFISPATVSRWETGAREPSIDALFKIAEVLEVELSMLLTDKAKASSSRGLNVLLAGDDQMVLDEIMRKLGTLIPADSIQCFTAPDDALGFASLHPVDIAFVGTGLQGKSGVDLARSLQFINNRTNIIFLADSAKYMQEAWQMHASGYLLKPFDPDKIKQELQCLRFPFSHSSSLGIS